MILEVVIRSSFPIPEGVDLEILAHRDGRGVYYADQVTIPALELEFIDVRVKRGLPSKIVGRVLHSKVTNSLPDLDRDAPPDLNVFWTCLTLEGIELPAEGR